MARGGRKYGMDIAIVSNFSRVGDIHIVNSCSIDSLLQAVACCIKDYGALPTVDDAPIVRLLRLMIEATNNLTEDTLQRIHYLRTAVLYKDFGRLINGEHYLDCTSDIWNIITKMILPVFPNCIYGRSRLDSDPECSDILFTSHNSFVKRDPESMVQFLSDNDAL